MKYGVYAFSLIFNGKNRETVGNKNCPANGTLSRVYVYIF